MKESMPTILCVDDEPEFLELLREYFASQGFNVLTARNGIEALFQVMRWNPQAVILDLFMPHLGGLGALDRIRRLDPRIVIILLSGVPNVLEMVTEAGVSVAGAFTKPVDLTELSEALARAGVGPGSVPQRPAPGEPLPGSRGALRGRVMVVDDDQGFREVLIGYLKEKGFETAGAATGEEALRRVPDFRPHVVLLDLALPGISGAETLRRIKALAHETCVVMVSGNEDLETAQRMLAMGAADYVSKPVNFRYLDTVLEIHLLMDRLDRESP